MGVSAHPPSTLFCKDDLLRSKTRYLGAEAAARAGVGLGEQQPR